MHETSRIPQLRICRYALVSLCLFLQFILMAVLQAGSAIGVWQRLSREPIFSPSGTTWQAAGTFNPAAVSRDEKVILLFRSQDLAGSITRGMVV